MLEPWLLVLELVLGPLLVLEPPRLVLEPLLPERELLVLVLEPLQ